MTLIELTVVILVLLALIAVLFVGARAYMKAADRTACIMNQRNIQQACRSYLYLNRSDMLINSVDELVAAEFLGTVPKCPTSQSSYTIRRLDRPAPGGMINTASGFRFTNCPTRIPAHLPDDYASW